MYRGLGGLCLLHVELNRLINVMLLFFREVFQGGLDHVMCAYFYAIFWFCHGCGERVPLGVSKKCVDDKNPLTTT
jgi:hypothetical protein